jgi:hypothetical protein
MLLLVIILLLLFGGLGGGYYAHTGCSEAASAVFDDGNIRRNVLPNGVRQLVGGAIQ